MKRITKLVTTICLSFIIIMTMAEVSVEASTISKSVKDEYIDIKEEQVEQSASTDDTGMLGDKISVADNINLFQSRSLSGYSQQWSNSTIIGSVQVTGYGVVTGHNCDSNSDLWYLDMQSNIRGQNSNYSISRFKWSVDNSRYQPVNITSWSPSGTTEATYDGYPVNVSIGLAAHGGAGSVGTSFTVLEKYDKVIGAVTHTEYDMQYYVEFTTNNPVESPNVQDLNAVVHYDNTECSNTVTWTWRWAWTYSN